MVEQFFGGLVSVFQFPTLPLMLVGIVIGFIVGILPGIGASTALALMLPFTYTMQPVEAFAFLLGMVSVTATTGDITSILFGVPGEPTSAAVIADGHAMAKKGEAGRALGAALMSALIGAILGAFVLALSIPIIRPLVLAIGSPELFALAALGVTFVATLSGTSKLKGIVSGGVGLMIAMVGLDPQTGIQRYTFGVLDLWDGIGLVAIVVGFFGVPEIVDLFIRGTSIGGTTRVGKIGGVLQGVRDTFDHWTLTLRCSVFGTVIGVLPGLGGAVAQWFAYAHAVQTAPSAEREGFGKGDVRGVIGPAAASNSKEGGNLMPLIAFGVPNTVPMALLLSAFLIKGLQPGQNMLTQHLDLTFSFVWIIVVSNVITVAACFGFLEQLVKITFVRGSLLIPGLILLVFLGAFAERDSVFDLGVALAAGIVGLVMVRLDWPRPPLVLGLVLGPLMERNLFVAYGRYEYGFLVRPAVAVILLGGLAFVLYPSVRGWLRRRAAKTA